MKSIRMAALAIALSIFPLAALAEQDVTEPTEVGTTTIHPGEYVLTEKKSNKAYSLMVTKKGMMIMGPAGAAAMAPPAPSS